MIKELDRRTFLKGSILAGAGAATLGLSSCQPSNGNQAKSATKTDASKADSNTVLNKANDYEAEFKSIEVSYNETLDYDVVVIGGGTSGTCAALSAAQNGARTIAIEKSSITGGMANVSRCIAGTDTALQKEAGREITSDDLYCVMRDHYKGTNNLPLVRDILDNSADTIDWLTENGLGLIAWPEQVNLQPGIPYKQMFCGHMMQGSTREAATPNGATGNLQGLWNTYLEDYSGELMLNTRAVKLIADDANENITGVVIEDENGSQTLINAKAVILAAGSWAGNTDYFRDVLAHTTHFTIHSGDESSKDEGDGIYLAEEVGAKRWISMPFWHQIYFANLDGTSNIAFTDVENQATLRYDPNLIWVNSEGTRFCDESIVGAFAQRGSAAFCQGGDLWLVFDRAALEDIETNGSKSSVPDMIKLEPGSGILAKVEEDVANGMAFEAKTLEELAEQVGFDTDEFLNTVKTYNTAVDEKQDRLFLKDAQYLSYPISSAPYYCYRMIANNEGGSIGGVRVNRDLKVYIGETGKTFGNLFATGLNASGFFGYGPYVDIMGMTMGFATGSGRLAGKRAAELSKK